MTILVKINSFFYGYDIQSIFTINEQAASNAIGSIKAVYSKVGFNKITIKVKKRVSYITITPGFSY